jgi:hypothetical protein
MKKYYREEHDCLNCGANVELKFCTNCGQENLQIKESFGHMMNHTVSDYFHFDHQLLHTLKPLFFQPGRLTNEYIAGHRVQFLHPVKMYIFISFLYFLLLFQTTFAPKAAYRHELIGTNKETNRIFPPTTKDTSYSEYQGAQQKLSVGQRDGFFIRQYNKRAFSYQEKFGTRAGDVFLDELKHNVPKMMFFLLPLFALIVMVTFRKNRKYYVEHLIYGFHLHCFLFLFLVIVMLLKMVLPAFWGLEGWLDLAAVLYITWYVFQSLREVYKRNRILTLIKILAMSFSYFVVFVLCMSIVLLMTAMIIPS